MLLCNGEDPMHICAILCLFSRYIWQGLNQTSYQKVVLVGSEDIHTKKKKEMPDLKKLGYEVAGMIVWCSDLKIPLELFCNYI